MAMGIATLNEHEADTFDEPFVFGGLATMQQKALMRLMAQMSLLCSDWPIHHERLMELENRVRETGGKRKNVPRTQ
jgi:hypothetical protein